MPVFRYIAQTKEGSVVAGKIESVNVNIAIDTLTGNRLRILEIKPTSFDIAPLLSKLNRVSQSSVVMVTRRLATMLKSGLSLDRALNILHQQEENSKLKLTIQALLHDIRSGSSLSWSMTKHPDVFSNMFISMVKVGETTGEMALMLEKLSDFLERDMKVKQQAKAAMTYPAFIMAFSLIIIIVIFVYVLPTLLGVFGSMNAELPLPTRVILAIVTTSRNFYVQMGLLLGIVYYAVYTKDFLQTPEGKFKFDRMKLSIPGLKSLNKKLVISNFTRALGTLLASGIPLMKSLEILMDFVDNEYFKQLVIQPLYDGIREGRSFSLILGESGFFPAMATQMIAVGESTGELPYMLAKISEFYDVEIVYSLETFLAALEPVMIGVLGLIVCFILVAVFMPLYSFIMKLG